MRARPRPRISCLERPSTRRPSPSISSLKRPKKYKKISFKEKPLKTIAVNI